ncbi:hypothetical protein KUTeg_009987 [Tegillarca granosa]|uniref:Dynein regulatory complex protein 10 n=1 Tax=Tegillarca granosa TaxID=220873 RepID=A0ABQ9F5K4_TEGGR|nr:hypothetical protein KUTeg_009987 [Tegillarca granosa]
MATAALPQPAQVMTEGTGTEPTLQIKLQMPQPPSMAKGPRNRIRLDPSRALEPARKKIATIEAQRVMSVFEDTIKKSEVITVLPFVLENLDRFRVVLGSELIGLLEQHKVLQGSYNEIKQQLDIQMRRMRKARIRTASSGKSEEAEGEREPTEHFGEVTEDSFMKEDTIVEEPEERAESRASSKAESTRSRISSAASMESQAERTMRNLSLVAQQLSTSCKNVLRAFSINRAAMSTVLQQAARSHETQDLVNYLNDLKDILLNKLLTTPGEERERMEYIQQIKKKNDVIRRLQLDHHQIQKTSQEKTNHVKNEADKQESADTKNSEGKRQRYQQEINQLKTQLQNHILEHRENEQKLRRDKFKVETNVDNLIQKFDAAMTERQNEYEEIDAIYTEEKKQLHELEERFKTLDTEYQQIMEERRVAREKREAAEREMALMIKAATTVQAFWRSYKVRKALKGRKKKGGGKKKK